MEFWGPTAALNNGNNGGVGVSPVPLWRQTAKSDGVVDMWDAPMPPSEVSVAIRGTGDIKQVLKEFVYYTGVPNTLPIGSGGTQGFPNPYYYSNIPATPYQAAEAAGGGFIWDSWGTDGPNVTGCPTSSFAICSGGRGPYH